MLEIKPASHTAGAAGAAAGGGGHMVLLHPLGTLHPSNTAAAPRQHKDAGRGV